MTDKLWSSLIRNISVSGFEKASSQTTIRSNEGVNKEIGITTEHYSFRVLNGKNDDKNFQKLATLVRTLEKMFNSYLKEDAADRAGQ